MTWVIDASVVVAYLLGEASDDERRAMLEDGHAPALVDVEVTQTLRGLVRGAKLEIALADLARGDLTQLGLHRHPDVHLLPRCWALRDVCSTYDALYVALAEVLEATSSRATRAWPAASAGSSMSSSRDRQPSAS